MHSVKARATIQLKAWNIEVLYLIVDQTSVTKRFYQSFGRIEDVQKIEAKLEMYYLKT